MRYRSLLRPLNKYGAKKTVVDEFSFDSKKEAAYYSQLKILKANGSVAMFLRQVPFHLPGGVKYVLDFLVFWTNGNVEFVDVKGFRTKEYIIKKKLVESIYNVAITER